MLLNSMPPTAYHWKLTRDILEERGLSVDEVGFKTAMDEHRIASGGGKAMGEMGGGDVAIYSEILDNLVKAGKLPGKA